MSNPWKQTPNSKRLRDFTEDLYDHFWSKQNFKTKDVSDAYFEGYISRLEHKNETVARHFDECIGNAVWVSHLLLRDYFRHFFMFIEVRKNFKQDVKLLWSHWLENRSNIFVKVIDTLAIIAGAVLHCDHVEDFVLKPDEATEWFTEWFEEHLSGDFYRSGGWKQLKVFCSEWYLDLFEKLDPFFRHVYPKGMKYEDHVYYVQIIKYLENSKVLFPAPVRVMPDELLYEIDKNSFRRVIYLRVYSEVTAEMEASKTNKVDNRNCVNKLSKKSRMLQTLNSKSSNSTTIRALQENSNESFQNSIERNADKVSEPSNTKLLTSNIESTTGRFSHKNVMDEQEDHDLNVPKTDSSTSNKSIKDKAECFSETKVKHNGEQLKNIQKVQIIERLTSRIPPIFGQQRLNQKIEVKYVAGEFGSHDKLINAVQLSDNSSSSENVLGKAPAASSASELQLSDSVSSANNVLGKTLEAASATELQIPELALQNCSDSEIQRNIKTSISETGPFPKSNQTERTSNEISEASSEMCGSAKSQYARMLHRSLENTGKRSYINNMFDPNFCYFVSNKYSNSLDDFLEECDNSEPKKPVKIVDFLPSDRETFEKSVQTASPDEELLLLCDFNFTFLGKQSKPNKKAPKKHKENVRSE